MSEAVTKDILGKRTLPQDAEWKALDFEENKGIVTPTGGWLSLKSLDAASYATFCFREGIRTGQAMIKSSQEAPK